MLASHSVVSSWGCLQSTPAAIAVILQGTGNTTTPPLLKELLISKSAEARHFQSKIRNYNYAMATASLQADFVARGARESKFNPTVSVHGRIYHAIGALRPPTRIMPRFASVYILDTDHSASNRKQFYGELRENILRRLSSMLHQNNKLVKIFTSLRD